MFSGGAIETETGARWPTSRRSLRRANSMGEHGGDVGHVLRLATGRLPDIHRLCVLFGPVRIQLQRGADRHLDEGGERGDPIARPSNNRNSRISFPHGISSIN